MKLSKDSVEYFTHIALMTNIPVHKVAQDALKLNKRHQRLEEREKEWKQWAKDMMALEDVRSALAPSGSLGSLKDRFNALMKGGK